MTTTKAICVWLDTTSEPGSETWIISQDRLNDRGEAETTATIDTCETRDEAIAWGKAIAEGRGLPLYENPAEGAPVLLQARPEAEEVG